MVEFNGRHASSSFLIEILVILFNIMFTQEPHHNMVYVDSAARISLQNSPILLFQRF